MKVKKSLNELVLNDQKVRRDILLNVSEETSVAIVPCYGCKSEQEIEIRRISIIRDTVVLELIVNNVEMEIPLHPNYSLTIGGVHFSVKVEEEEYEEVIEYENVIVYDREEEKEYT
ncbi:MAG: hypothetical protein JHC31_09605 [Sulfurihydrogenibium sp.]|jgi:hypothetical protein|nr:hypothetical protein [Sulfurihydrogenibium sp.]